MRTYSILSAILCAVALCASRAQADQKLRVQVDQRGDFALIGNTLGWDCGANTPPPTVGSVPALTLTDPLACGVNAVDSSSDVFWRADDPAAGQATASIDFTAADARSSAVLALPDGAEITHAFLYWAARHAGSGADTEVLIEREGAFKETVTAADAYTLAEAGDTVYESVADVTDIVRDNANGVYRVSGVDASNFPDSGDDVMFAGWSLLVLYRLDSEPPRNLAVFDGLDSVGSLDNVGAAASTSVSLSGFLVPMAGFDAKLGTLTYEGDDQFNGDALRFGTAPLDAADVLTDALNPADNFFNGTRSLLGQAVSVKGDLPQLTGQASSMSGLDIDVIDITSHVSGGQTTADLEASSMLDIYYVGMFVTSISTFRPDFVDSTKSVKDVNGGVLEPGDEIEYTIVVTNTGNDASVMTVLTDAIPDQTTLVPGSIQIADGANAGAKTEAGGDDEADFDAAKRTLTVRLGKGASATAGGSIELNGASTVVFRVKVDKGAKGTIANQGSISAAGERGAPVSTTLTDGNADGPGSPPTEIPIGECMKDAQCPMTAPRCDLTGDPHVCVQCLDDKDCADAAPTCDEDTHTCVCEAGMDKCSDADDDGLTDGDENEIGTDPHDADTDDDGVGDGQEIKPGEDSDGDGTINARDPDSDDDGLADGTELGLDCSAPATDVTAGFCKPDADMGATKTDPLDADTDGGSVKDGDEDTNHDGKIDTGERDPNDPADDVPQPMAPPDAGMPSRIREIAGGGCGVSGQGAAGAPGVLLLAAAALLVRRRTRSR
jgi:uncharacterized repeat protein (TIGR01451 family)